MCACRIPESMTWQEAILIEFEEPIVQPADFAPAGTRRNTKMRTENTFTHVNEPVDNLDVPVPVTPVLLMRSLSIEPPRKQLFLKPPSKSSKHVRLPSSSPVDGAVHPITSGNGMMALFDDEQTPRTRYDMIVSDIDDSEICNNYPQFVRQSLLRVFYHEGWSPAMIFANLDADQRKVSPGPNPWLWLEEAMNKEKKVLIETYGQQLEEAGATTSATPKSKKIMQPKWTAEEDQKLCDLRAEGKTQKEIAEALGRTLSGVQSRVHTLKKKAEAAAAVATACGSDDTVDDNMHQTKAAHTVVVADAGEAGGDAMQLD